MTGDQRVVAAIVGKVFVDTTIAVIAESEKEAERMAFRGVSGDSDRWDRDSPAHDDPACVEPLA